MSALDAYKEALTNYNAVDETAKAGLRAALVDAHTALTEDEKTANPLPDAPAAAPMGGRKSSRKSGGSRAGKRGGKRASKRGGSRASKRGGSRASKRGGKRGGSRSSRR